VLIDETHTNVESNKDKKDALKKTGAQKEENLTPSKFEKNTKESFGSGEKEKSDKNEESTKIDGESSRPFGD
jgi:hypothetical protein